MNNFKDENEIRQALEENGSYDDFTLTLLTQYLVAVQNSLSDYITIDEAIRRFTSDDRLKGGIQVVDDLDNANFDATYVRKEKCIYVTSDGSYDHSKFVIFHELTHVLSIQELGDNMTIGLVDSSKGKYYNNGFNEAVTEYIAFKLMDENYDYRVTTGYQVVVEQLINLMETIPEPEIIDCFLYNCRGFDDILRKHGIDDTEKIKNIFDILQNKEKTIVQLRRFERPDDEKDTKMLVIKDYLYELYTRKFLPVDSIEKFEEKIKFVSKFIEQHDSLNFVDEYGTAMDILCDKEDLVEMGCDEDQLLEILEKYEIDVDMFNQLAEFNFLDATLCTEDDSERTAKAIKMYEMYEELGRNQYIELTDRFIFRLYNDFFLSNPDNYRDLCDHMKIPVIGKFLKNNPQYDFDELDISKISFRMGDRRNSMIVIKTLDRKTYFLQYDLDAESVPTIVETTKGTYLLNYRDNGIRIELSFVGDEVSVVNLNNPDIDMEERILYSRGSNYEHLREKAQNDNGVHLDSGKRHSQIFEECNSRIQERRKDYNNQEFDY